MNDTTHTDTPTCECGNPAIVDADGFVTTIYDGMHYFEVCDACWREPENIATEVLHDVVVFAMGERLPHDVTWASLDPAVVREAIRSLAESLAARGSDVTDPDVFNPHMETLSRCWDEWYAA